MPRSVDQGGDVAGSVHSFTTEQTSATDELNSANSHKKYKWHKRFAYQKFVGWRPILTPHIAGARAGGEQAASQRLPVGWCRLPACVQ